MKTSKNLIINIGDKVYNVPVTGEKYKRISALMTKLDNMGEECSSEVDLTVNAILSILDTGSQIKKVSKGRLDVDGRNVVDKKTSTKLHPVFLEKIKEFSFNSKHYESFIKFWDNLNKNPNKNSVDQLYRFLEANKFPITDDGCFLAYKKVDLSRDGKFVDNYTKTIDNSVGKIVVMDRDKCNTNPDETCSFGLHVASYEYALGYAGDVMVQVKVNPKDVVAVPSDYNNQKMRVCRYEVLCVGDKFVTEEYISAKFIAGKKLENTESNEFAKIELMTAREIVDFVNQKTGQYIDLSLKSKQSIIKKAYDLLNYCPHSTLDEIDLSDKTAQEIIDIVFNQTGEMITYSVKSKNSIIRKAIEILQDHGINVKV